MNKGQNRASFSNRSSNPIADARMKDRMVGSTIGSRREIARKKQSPINPIPARKQLPDSFGHNENQASDTFKTGNSYANARRYDKNSPYKHVRVAKIESGAASLQRGVLGRPSDNDLVGFLNKIGSDSRLHSARSIRENFGRKTRPASPQARQTVTKMAAEHLKKRPVKSTRPVPSSKPIEQQRPIKRTVTPTTSRDLLAARRVPPKNSIKVRS